MRRIANRSLFVLGIAIACARAQQPPAAGLETPWDVRKILTDVTAQATGLKPLLAQLNPQQWADKGASTTYILQWQGAQRQLDDVQSFARQLSQKTDSLSLALEVYFRLEALEVTARSLEEGAQRYGTRAHADQLAAYIAQSFDSRQRLRDYLKDLTASTEQNFKIADEEAQRCRGIISKEAPSSSRKKH
jgi:type II secretory pathway component GspD/PulD (secretin)